MPTFEPWDGVKVPFPYTNRSVRQLRPALVVAVSDLGTAGLPASSVVRTAKIAVIDSRDAEQLGTLPNADRPAVAAHLVEHLGAIIAALREA